MASTIAQDFRHIGLLEEVASLFNDVSTGCNKSTVNEWMATRYGGWVRHGVDFFYKGNIDFKQLIK